MLKRTGTTTVTELPRSSGGGGGNGCERWIRETASWSSAADPELRTRCALTSDPERVIVNLTEATALLERASKLRPDDAAITDSLGWAYFRQGDIAKALPLLEKAAQNEPGSATINEHLGDAYWRTGRRYEARYAWRAAALYAEGEQKVRLSAKLADGIAQRTAAN